MDWLALNTSENEESPFSLHRDLYNHATNSRLGEEGWKVTERGVIKYTGTISNDPYSTQASQSFSSTSFITHCITTINPR